MYLTELASYLTYFIYLSMKLFKHLQDTTVVVTNLCKSTVEYQVLNWHRNANMAFTNKTNPSRVRNIYT